MKNIQHLFDRSYRGELTAFVAGLLTVLSFAPFKCWILAFIAPAMLLGTWLYAPSLRRTFFRGLAYGLGLFGFGVYWIYISIHTFGEAPIWLSLLLTALFATILALFPAFTGLMLNYFFPYNTHDKMLRAFPAVWVLFEWIRSWIFSGFPWLTLGYSQVGMPTVYLASFFGVLGLSLFVAINAGAMVYLIFASRKQRIFTSLYIISIWIGWSLFSLVHLTEPAGKPITVSLIQGNIAQSLKWQPEQLQPTLNTYTDLTEPHWNSDLIVWPEGAIPISMEDAGDFINALNDKAIANNSAILVGVPVENAYGTAFYNSLLALGDAHGTYLKYHLVPFGEYTPLPQLLLPIMKLINIPMSNFVPGRTDQKSIRFKDYNIATFICYEIAFAEEVKRRVADANFIVSISDDAWFGHSIAQAQHLQMAQMRAIENGKPVLFSTNDGLTAIIDHRGNIIKQAEPYTATSLTGEITPMQYDTIWDVFGLDQLILLCAIMYLSAILRRRMQPIVVKNQMNPNIR